MSNSVPNIILIEHFISSDEANNLFDLLRKEIEWNKQMKSRFTASSGTAYQYSGIKYVRKPFPKELLLLSNSIEKTLGFKPNNCLLNYYLDGKSKMGFHSDDISQMVDGTGVAILSLGDDREMKFKAKNNDEHRVSYTLKNGSLLYMDDKVQIQWLHSIPKSDTTLGRISVTFRQLII